MMFIASSENRKVIANPELVLRVILAHTTLVNARIRDGYDSVRPLPDDLVADQGKLYRVNYANDIPIVEEVTAFTP